METVFERKLVKIERKDSVYFLTMRNKMNILSYEMMDQLNQAYDFMEHKTEGAACLITRSAITKVFSAGLNLKFLLKIKDIKEEKVKYLSTYQALLSKLLKLPMITIAAINGHAYAAGLALALCHDYRLMNQDFGNLCMSEIKYGLPLPPGVNAVCKHRIAQEYYKYIMLTGEPVQAKIGKRAKILDDVLPLEKLEEKAAQMAKTMAVSGKHRKAMKKIKYDMNKEMIDELQGGIEPGTGRILKPNL